MLGRGSSNIGTATELEREQEGSKFLETQHGTQHGSEMMVGKFAFRIPGQGTVATLMIHLRHLANEAQELSQHFSVLVSLSLKAEIADNPTIKSWRYCPG